MLPPFNPKEHVGYSEGALKALYAAKAKQNIEDNQHIVELARELHGYSTCLLRALESDQEISSQQFKSYFHKMYGYIVKMTVWRQFYFNDFQPIRLRSDYLRKRIQER